MSDRDTIVGYIEKRAERMKARAAEEIRDAPYFEGTATIFRALASDIRAKLDQP